MLLTECIQKSDAMTDLQIKPIRSHLSGGELDRLKPALLVKTCALGYKLIKSGSGFSQVVSKSGGITNQQIVAPAGGAKLCYRLDITMDSNDVLSVTIAAAAAII